MVRSLPLAGLVAGLLAAAPALAQEAPRTLTLEEAQALAGENSHAVGAMRQKVEEMRSRRSMAFTHYLPRIDTRVAYLVNNNEQGILIPQGSLGFFPELGGSFPPSNRNIPQGGTDLFFTFTTLAQPLTHVFKIRQGRGVATADEEAARAELDGVGQEVALGVLEAYAGLLVAGQGRELARARVAAAQERLSYREAAVASGTVHEVAGREGRVQWLQARQALLEKDGEVDDLAYALADAIGLPPETRFSLQGPASPEVRPLSLEPYLEAALRENPEVRAARALVRKADHGVGAARADYIPEVGILGTHIYQSSVPFFPKHTLGVGVQAKWTVFDFGARSKVVQERRAQLGQAERNLDMVEGRVRGEVEAAYRRLERAAEMVELAREGMALRSEASRLRVLQASTGYALPADTLEAEADRMEGELDVLKAELAYRIALAELEKAAGTLRR